MGWSTGILVIVQPLIKKAGAVLMLAVWLPLSFFNRSPEDWSSTTGQITKPSPVEFAYVFRSPQQALPFHQLRLSELQRSLSQPLGLELAEGDLQSNQNLSRLARCPANWLALGDFLPEWSFSHRVAPHPRAPCWA